MFNEEDSRNGYNDFINFRGGLFGIGSVKERPAVSRANETAHDRQLCCAAA